MNMPMIMNGTPIPTEYANRRLNASPGVVAASVSIEPKIGPTHGVHPAANARPKINDSGKLAPVREGKIFFSKFSFFLLLNSIIIGDQDRPNIIWITSEDNSRDLYHIYNETGAYTPNLERLVDHGLVFENAYSQGPVCSVARSTLISGAYAPRIGAHYHRKTKLVPMPSNLKMFPSYLRDVGLH